MKTLKVLLSLLVLWQISFAQAADQDDFYIEASFGSNLKLSGEMISDLSIGYVPVDTLGFGFYAGQEFAGVERYQAISGTMFGFESRWFLEPFEVAGVLGLKFKEPKTDTFFHASAAYLHAMTPAMAVKAELKARLNVGTQWLILATIGARLLF